MTATFQVADLVKTAELVLGNDELARKEHTAAVAEYKAQHEREWRDAGGRESVRRYRDKVSAALKSSKPITKVPDPKWYSPPDKYHLDRMVKRPPAMLNDPDRAELQAMLAMLRDLQADSVTANHLKLMGFDRVSVLYRLAAK